MKTTLANELRLENWILNAANKPIKVTAERISDIQSNLVVAKPIPLSEEILLKIEGITHHYHDHSDKPYDTYSLNESFTDMGGIGTDEAELIIFYQNDKYEINGMEVKHLHDLQNIAYYLNNKTELQINL